MGRETYCILKILKERGVICHTVEMDTYRSYENFEKNCNSLADLLKNLPIQMVFLGAIYGR